MQKVFEFFFDKMQQIIRYFLPVYEFFIVFFLICMQKLNKILKMITNLER